MLVDVHTHCLKPEHWGTEFRDHWKPNFGYDYPDISPAAFGATMSNAGVDVAIVFGLTAAAAGVRTPHNFVASFCRETGIKTIGFMSLDPADADVLDQVDEGISVGLKGVKLYPVLAGFSPIQELVQPLLDLLERRGLAVLWHMGRSPSPRERSSPLAAAIDRCRGPAAPGPPSDYRPHGPPPGSATPSKCCVRTVTFTRMCRASGRGHGMVILLCETQLNGT